MRASRPWNALVWLLGVTLVFSCAGCDESRGIEFVPLAVYDPYPAITAREAGEDSGATVLLNARVRIEEARMRAEQRLRTETYEDFDAAIATGELRTRAKSPDDIPYPVAPHAERIHLNLASSEELQVLPRVGPAMAERIIAARPFPSVESLIYVRGIGPATLARIRGSVTVELEALPPVAAP